MEARSRVDQGSVSSQFAEVGAAVGVAVRDDDAVVIRAARDIDRLVGRGRSPFGARRTIVAVTHLPFGDAREAEARLNRQARACGCESAAVAAAAGFLGYMGLLFVTRGAPPGWGLGDLLWGLAVTFGAAACGKAFGFLHAQRRWLAELERLRIQIVLAGERGGA